MSRWLTLCLALACLLAPSVAEAFHVAKTFAAHPDDGGAGDIYYTGTPKWRGWDCTACHQDPPGRVELRVSVEDSLADFIYEPGQTYAFTAKMKVNGEELGKETGKGNFNALAVSATDRDDLLVGMLKSPDFSGLDGAIAFKGLQANVTSWAFTWTAPDEAGHGNVTLHFGLVDGNGAKSTEAIRSDPFGDDVYMTKITLTEKAGTKTARWLPQEEEERLPWTLAFGSCVLVLLGFRGVRLTRGARGRRRTRDRRRDD